MVQKSLSDEACLSLSAASQKLDRVGQADESGSNAEEQAQISPAFCLSSNGLSLLCETKTNGDTM
jgi:hypothetical protein